MGKDSDELFDDAVRWWVAYQTARPEAASLGSDVVDGLVAELTESLGITKSDTEGLRRLNAFVIAASTVMHALLDSFATDVDKARAYQLVGLALARGESDTPSSGV